MDTFQHLRAAEIVAIHHFLNQLALRGIDLEKLRAVLVCLQVPCDSEAVLVDNGRIVIMLQVESELVTADRVQ